MLQSTESQRVGHNLVTEQQKHSEIFCFQGVLVMMNGEEIFIDHSLNAQCECLLS